MDGCHEPICHSVRFTLSRISPMTTEFIVDLAPPSNPSPSVARVWPTTNPSKGWPLATRLRRAKGLDRVAVRPSLATKRVRWRGTATQAASQSRSQNPILHKLSDTPDGNPPPTAGRARFLSQSVRADFTHLSEIAFARGALNGVRTCLMPRPCKRRSKVAA